MGTEPLERPDSPAASVADGSNYRVADDPGTEVADGSSYRDDEALGSETADGSNYRDDEALGSESADGSNYSRSSEDEESSEVPGDGPGSLRPAG